MIVNNRAITDEQKEEVIDRLLTAWKKQPKQRLGQLIYNVCYPMDIFYIEDYDLITLLENKK